MNSLEALENVKRFIVNKSDNIEVYWEIVVIEQTIKALEIIKECFNLNGFDELIPNSKWFESKEKRDLLKEVLGNE